MKLKQVRLNPFRNQERNPFLVALFTQHLIRRLNELPHAPYLNKQWLTP